jgi:hypothetical protein
LTETDGVQRYSAGLWVFFGLAYPGYWAFFLVIAGAAVGVAGCDHLSPSYFVEFISLFFSDAIGWMRWAEMLGVDG